MQWPPCRVVLMGSVWWWGALGAWGWGQDAVREEASVSSGQGVGGPCWLEQHPQSHGLSLSLCCVFGEWGIDSPTRASGVTGSGGSLHPP